jgi:hypothetical protein
MGRGGGKMKCPYENELGYCRKVELTSKCVGADNCALIANGGIGTNGIMRDWQSRAEVAEAKCVELEYEYQLWESTRKELIKEQQKIKELEAKLAAVGNVSVEQIEKEIKDYFINFENVVDKRWHISQYDIMGGPSDLATAIKALYGDIIKEAKK